MAPPQHLPHWFLAAAVGSVAFTLVWMVGLVALQHSPQLAATVSDDGGASLYLYAGVLNSLLGSFLSASGYCCQKFAHVRVQRDAALGTVSQQPLFVFGLFLLAVGTVSAVLNLGILGQAVQAPFAALTLIYSALLGRFVLRERFALFDFFSSVLIIAGVAIDVLAAQLAQVPQQTYTLASLGALLFRDSLWPLAYTVVALSYVALLLRHVRRRSLHHRAAGLLAFSSSAGIMAGFTSLATKSAVEVVKAALRSHRVYDLVNPFFVLIVLGIPCALVPQLFLLNKGLEFFGTLKFIPLYQAFIILGNTGCGMVFYNEMQSYSTVALLTFLAGVAVTLAGVSLLLAKVSSTTASSEETRPLLPVAAAVDPFATQLAWQDLAFAQDVEPLADFDACKRRMVSLLRSASHSVYYSTFLCDFTQELAADTTLLSLLHAAVERGVHVHILYNPVVDYGTASLAQLKTQLPAGVALTCRVSDLGPSPLTKLLSSNSKYAFHHQKYLCVDDARVMVTGCDVNRERDGWRTRNALGYYWHELGVVAACSPKMAQWIHRNHEDAYDHRDPAPPLPLLAGGWREENAMVLLILHAQRSVQLENQILISGGAAQHNRIVDAIAERVGRAHASGERFHVLLLTNAAQQDEPSLVTRWYCTLSIQWSLEALEAAALQRGLSREQLRAYVLVARLEADGVLVKVHSNILIVDGRLALRSSSNLADRSLSARPTDTELGLLFEGDAVATLQRTLLRMYADGEDEEDEDESLATVLERVRRHGRSGCVVPLEKKGWSPVVTWFLMNLFVYGSEGATGGRVQVNYTTTREVIGATAPGA